ncbi:hypothetical protein HDE_10882 [Halotydeus destructor]|nr:hypothetical protein HDE_10882 [Halotydeus destructor]
MDLITFPDYDQLIDLVTGYSDRTMDRDSGTYDYFSESYMKERQIVKREKPGLRDKKGNEQLENEIQMLKHRARNVQMDFAKMKMLMTTVELEPGRQEEMAALQKGFMLKCQELSNMIDDLHKLEAKIKKKTAVKGIKRSILSSFFRVFI